MLFHNVSLCKTMEFVKIQISCNFIAQIIRRMQLRCCKWVDLCSDISHKHLTALSEGAVSISIKKWHYQSQKIRVESVWIIMSRGKLYKTPFIYIIKFKMGSLDAAIVFRAVVISAYQAYWYRKNKWVRLIACRLLYSLCERKKNIL